MTPIRLDAPERGVLFVVTGPSGTGKSTLIEALPDRGIHLEFSVSATTRPPRPHEREGVQYHFVDRPRFDAMVAQGELLEHAVVYDQCYGTPRQPVEEALRQGRSILLDIDLLGARQVRVAMPEAVLVFIAPPSITALETRLRGRGTESAEVVARRMDEARDQLRGAPDFDYLLVNDDLATARAIFEGIVLAELHRTARREKAALRVARMADPDGGVLR